MRNIAAWLKEHDDFAIVPHVSPDGDSYGSCLAMAMALQGMGKRAFVAAPPVPLMYDFLPGQDLLHTAGDMPFAPKAIVHMDTASPDRVCTQFDSALESALIDHHETNPGFDDVRWIDSKASSVGEMLVQLLHEMGAPITKDMATCIYTAISTDTGNFQFASTTPASLRAAAELIECGLEIGEASAHLFRSRTLARTQLLGEALHAMQLHGNGAIATTVVTKEMMARCQAGHADTEGIVNFLNEIRGVKAAALLEERDGETKCSLRSQEHIDVAQIARVLGGGGHRSAAGVTIKSAPQQALALILEKIGEAVG